MNKKLIIFDFDGVIADSFEYCLKTNQSMYGGLTSEQYKKMFEGNFYEAFSRVVDPKLADEYKDTYWIKFLRNLHEITIVEKMTDIISKLNKKCAILIISSSTAEAIEKIMKKENVGKYITKIYGSDYHESKVEKFKHALIDFHASADNCIFITDTLGDLLEAEKAGIKSVAVSWGFHDIDTLRRGKYIKIVHKPEELFDTIKSSMNI